MPIMLMCVQVTISVKLDIVVSDRDSKFIQIVTQGNQFDASSNKPSDICKWINQELEVHRVQHHPGQSVEKDYFAALQKTQAKTIGEFLKQQKLPHESELVVLLSTTKVTKGDEIAFQPFPAFKRSPLLRKQHRLQLNRLTGATKSEMSAAGPMVYREQEQVGDEIVERVIKTMREREKYSSVKLLFISVCCYCTCDISIWISCWLLITDRVLLIHLCKCKQQDGYSNTLVTIATPCMIWTNP